MKEIIETINIASKFHKGSFEIRIIYLTFRVVIDIAIVSSGTNYGLGMLSER